MKNILKLAIISLIIISLNSCSSDDSSSSDSAVFKAKIDGVDFEATTISNGQILQSTALQSQRFDVNGEDDNNRFLFAIENNNLEDCMPISDYTGSNVLIFFQYKSNTGNYFQEHDHFDENDNSNIIGTITSCSGNKISGTFSGTFYKNGTLQTEIVTPDVVEVTNGVFENIEFNIITP